MKFLSFNLIFLWMLIVFSVCSFSVHGQIIIPINENFNSSDKTRFITDILDSIMNKRQFTSGGIICVNETSISIDTVTIGKVKHIEKDSVVVGKFLKKHQKKISSKEFWGVITVSGQCQRFYKQTLYQVWETPSPYVYRLEINGTATYYFSDNLLSPLIALDRPTVNNTPMDTTSRRILNNIIDDRAKAQEVRVMTNSEQVVNISLNLVSVILQIMLSGNSYSHHNSSYHHTPSQTGPRR